MSARRRAPSGGAAAGHVSRETAPSKPRQRRLAVLARLVGGRRSIGDRARRLPGIWQSRLAGTEPLERPHRASVAIGTSRQRPSRSCRRALNPLKIPADRRRSGCPHASLQADARRAVPHLAHAWLAPRLAHALLAPQLAHAWLAPQRALRLEPTAEARQAGKASTPARPTSAKPTRASINRPPATPNEHSGQQAQTASQSDRHAVRPSRRITIAPADEPDPGQQAGVAACQLALADEGSPLIGRPTPATLGTGASSRYAGQCSEPRPAAPLPGPQDKTWRRPLK